MATKLRPTQNAGVSAKPTKGGRTRKGNRERRTLPLPLEIIPPVPGFMPLLKTEQIEMMRYQTDEEGGSP